MLRSAAAAPDTLVIGVDANLSGLGAGFSAAARRRLDNVLFVQASAESPPPELTGLADEVRVQFPWGSLLRLILEADPVFVSYLAGVLRPAGRLVVALSLIERDGIDGQTVLDATAVSAIGDRLAAGSADRLAFDRATAITPAMVKGLHSTWANRLGVGRTRPGWLLEWRRAEPPAGGQSTGRRLAVEAKTGGAGVRR